MFTDFGLQFFQKELIRLVGPSRKAKPCVPKPSEPASPMPTEAAEDENGEKNDEKSDGKPRKRKPYRPGIGGFLVRSRNRLVSKKQQDEQSSEKKSRKKKSKISDNYPPYIQEAFFGWLSQETKPETKPSVTPPKPVTTPNSSSNFIDATEFLTAVKPEPTENSTAGNSTTPSDAESNFDEFDSNSIIFLDSDLPERPASEESLEDDFDFFPAFPDDDAIFKEDGVDVNDIFEELEDDAESVDEEKSQPDKSKEPPVSTNLLAKQESMTPPQLKDWKMIKLKEQNIWDLWKIHKLWSI